MKRIVLAFGLVVAVGACGGKKKAAGDESGGQEEVECDRSSDCDLGYRCVKGECVQRTKRLKSNNPTAEGVKRDIERHQKKHTDRVDKSLDLPE